MKCGSKRFCIGVIIAAILFFFTGTSVYAQALGIGELPPDLIPQRGQAPMEAIFKNVLWGSVTGAITYAGLHMVNDAKTTEERYKVSSILEESVTGATYGGWIGLGVGIYMSLMGITFENTFISINFSPVDEVDYYEQQEWRYENRKIERAKRRVLSLQVRF